MALLLPCVSKLEPGRYTPDVLQSDGGYFLASKSTLAAVQGGKDSAGLLLNDSFVPPTMEGGNQGEN